MAIEANITSPLLGFVADVITSHLRKSDDDFSSNSSTELLLFDSGGIAGDGNRPFIIGEYFGEDADDPLAANNLLMPTWAYRLTAAYLLLISVLGLIMNVVVVIVILNDSQRMTPLNWMLLNLACSDGAIAGFGTPISTAAALEFGWPFSQELCVAYAMIMSTAGIGSITTLTALAIWRCQLVVCCPAKRKSAFTNHSGRLGCRQGVILLVIIWIYALAITCPPLFGWGRYDREAAHISCSVNWESKTNNNRSYILYMFCMGLVVPLAVIIISYVRILRVVQKQSGNVHRHRRDAAEKRVTMMVACMIAAFMAAWTPYSILALFETFIGQDNHSTYYSSRINNATNFSSAFPDGDLSYVGTISPAFATIPSLFAKTSAVLNPLIYGLLNTQFRLAWERFSLRFLGRFQCHRTQGVSGQHGANHHKTRRNVRKYLPNCYGDSRSLKPTPTVHLPMKEMVVSHAEQKVKTAQEQASSSVTKITTIPLISSDNQTIVSCPSSIMANCQQHETNQANHQQAARPDKVVDHQHLLQPNRLSSLLSLSLPSVLISTPNLPCSAQRQSAAEDQAMATCQQMTSGRIRDQQQQSDSFVVVGLLSRSADCYHHHTGDVEQFVFLDSTVDELGLTARSASP
ncbi:pteropsin9 [Daphnia pulex]|uniref:Pteropsin9 n=1 Tax=Daphnia pulex TaxID=6669 RepID=E9FU92_DAPPU|nr:pteropsin9 [Daphnia pulex]|eukprot:EFX89511.1 pteropsin9 [Daphnia pulex]